MTLKDWVIGGGVAVALILSVIGGGATTTTVINEPGEQPLGSVAGPDRSFDCESRNGVVECFGKQTMRQATSTVCAIKSPAATSTLVFGAAKFTYASTSATTVHLAKANTFNSTTTSLGFYALTAGQQGTLVASTTASAAEDGGAGNDILDPAAVFSPNQYFVVGVQSGVHGADTVGTGFVPTGTCNATFQII